MLVPCLLASVGGAGAALAGVAGLVSRRNRQRGWRHRALDTARPTTSTVNESLVALVHGEGSVVCIRQTSKGDAVATLAEFFGDTEYPSRAVFVVKPASAQGHVHLMPLLLPWMVLAASSDRCPLKVQGMRPRSTGQMWTCTPTGFISANSQAPVHLAATHMQPVPAAKIASWMRKVSHEAVLARQNDCMVQQLADGARLNRQLEKKVRSLGQQLEQQQQEHAVTQLAAQQQSAQHMQAQQELGVEKEEVRRARLEVEALRAQLAEQQATHAEEQEQHTHQLSSVQERAAQLERKVATLEQQLAAASEAVSAKEQRLDQLSQQLSNLQVAFDCVRATATERHEELQLWREKHAKLDTAMQAIKARMRMVSDGEERVRHLQASGVLRQADLRQLKQRLQRLGHQLLDDTEGPDAAPDSCAQANDLLTAPDNDRPLGSGAVGAGKAGRGGAQGDEPSGVHAGGLPTAGLDAVEEVMRDLQYESQYGSMEVLLRQSMGGGSTATLGSGKADSLAAWFGRGSRASVRSIMVDSAGSDGGAALFAAVGSSQQLPDLQEEAEDRFELPTIPMASAAHPGATVFPNAVSDSSNTQRLAMPLGMPSRPWVRPLLIVPNNDDDSSVNMASARPAPQCTRGSGACTARGERPTLGGAAVQLTPRRDQTDRAAAAPGAWQAGTPGKAPCTPTSAHSNEEYDILSEDKDGYDSGLSPSHRIPGNMLLAELDEIQLMSSSKRQACVAGGDDESEEGAAG